MFLSLNALDMWVVETREAFNSSASGSIALEQSCGLELVSVPNHRDQVCSLCQQCKKVQQRIGKLRQDIKRWQRKGDRPTSIEWTRTGITMLQSEAQRLLKSHRPLELIGL